MIWRIFCEVFNCLPIAAVVGDKIFCVHGRISPNLETLDDIKNLTRLMELPEEGFVCDLIWANPDNTIDNWGEYDEDEDSHEPHICFGADPVDKFLEKFGFDLICRGHQAIMNDYEFPFFPKQTIVTVSSAPNFCGEYDNKGVLLKINEELFCTFSLLEPFHLDE